MKRAIVPVSIATSAGLVLGACAYGCGLPWWLALGITILSVVGFGAVARGSQ